MIMAKKRVMFISSTGGHFNEMMQLKKLFDKYDYHIVTEKDEITKGYKKTYKDKIDYLPYGTRMQFFRYIFIFIYMCIKSLYLFIKIRPNVVITTGTHSAVPMCYIAKLFRRKVIFIETFANRNSKTLSGKLVYPIADLFIVQWEEMLKLYPKAVYGGAIY